VKRLWRTFQDRLESELRAAKATTVEQATSVLDRFLPEYNRQFARAASQTGMAYRKLDARLDLDYLFGLRYEWVVNRDHTVVVGWASECSCRNCPATPGTRARGWKSASSPREM